MTVSDTIISCGIDVLVATESWHQSSSDVAVRRSTPPGYSAVDRPRPDGSSYGGIVIFHRSTLSVRRISIESSPTTFEALAVSVSSPRGPLTILAVYRPGSMMPSSSFFNEFESLLEQFALYNTQLVIAGDFNLHLEDPSQPASTEILTIIDQFGLVQHVTEPTHKAGGRLDVVLTRTAARPMSVSIHRLPLIRSRTFGRRHLGRRRLGARLHINRS